MRCEMCYEDCEEVRWSHTIQAMTCRGCMEDLIEDAKRVGRLFEEATMPPKEVPDERPDHAVSEGAGPGV